MFRKATVISIALVAMLPTVTHAHDIYTNLTKHGQIAAAVVIADLLNRTGSSVEMLIDQQWLEIPRSPSNTVLWMATPVRQTGRTGVVSK